LNGVEYIKKSAIDNGRYPRSDHDSHSDRKAFGSVSSISARGEALSNALKIPDREGIFDVDSHRNYSEANHKIHSSQGKPFSNPKQDSPANAF
jgi:hypothetical protein